MSDIESAEMRRATNKVQRDKEGEAILARRLGFPSADPVSQYFSREKASK